MTIDTAVKIMIVWMLFMASGFLNFEKFQGHDTHFQPPDTPVIFMFTVVATP